MPNKNKQSPIANRKSSISLGFTLMELVVVMVILGIFASMIGPSFLDFRRKKDLEYGARNFQSLLAEGFSSSRSYSKIYRLTAEAEKLKLYAYDYKACCTGGCDFDALEEPWCQSTETTEEVISFAGTVRMSQPASSFSTYFVPPHGDIEWEDDTGVDGVLDVVIEDDYENRYAFKIHKKSGLIGQ